MLVLWPTTCPLALMPPARLSPATPNGVPPITPRLVMAPFCQMKARRPPVASLLPTTGPALLMPVA